ncbi:MAG: DNA repair and recombination protein RadB [Candidatus Aenigmarchaeota archaeon]|nr:DNA repair and recombination protein RadB [Candidatus Aenigmarchaeota archaeon]
MDVRKRSLGGPIDTLLKGGLECGVVTNVYGPAGSGKSNICMLATCMLSRFGKVLYIDTEGSFSYDRFRQMGGTAEQLLNILLCNVHDWKEQCAEVQKLSNLADDVQLIVIDSMVAHYRVELDQKIFRTMNTQLASQYATLSKLARTHGIPVVVTNQVYSTSDEKVGLSSNAVAKYWSKILIELKRLEQENQRMAIIRKHRSMPEGASVKFEIVEHGLQAIE